MVSEYWPTYVVLTLYIVATAVVTGIGYIKNKDPSDQHTHITKHFLASKSFGSIILTFTTFASVFSGYTVVGVPNETGQNGFTGVRWMSLIIVIAIAMLWLYPRLRRLSIVRSYESPGDFIKDRFESKSLSILIALLVCIPQVLYIGINVFSLGAVVENLTAGELGFYPVAVASIIICLVFEALGGMRSVAYTDTVEAIVMVAIFITVPIMISIFTGGFIGQINNSHNLSIPCSNSNDDETSGCLNYATNDIASEYYLRSPSQITILNYILFSLSGISFSLNPHITQRALTAKSDVHVRFVVVAIFLATFITMTPGILIGITHISNWNELKTEYQSYGAFQAMLAVFRDRGGFSAFVSYIALLAAIAGIMSTADSALIGVSNTISCAVFKNWVCIGSRWTSTRIVYVGKAVSLITMCLCLVFAIYLWETGAEYGVVYTIQQGLLWQAVPAYVFGLYTNMTTDAVLFGTIIGTIVDIILIGIVFGGYDPIPLVDKSWSTFVGVAANVIISVIAHYTIFKKHREGDEDMLSLLKIRKIMHGIKEPITKYYGALVWSTLALCLMSAFFWIGPISDDLLDVYGEEETKTFMYNGNVRNVIAGLPDWMFATLMVYVVAMALGIFATMQWTVHDEQYEHASAASMDTMPKDQDKLNTETHQANNGTVTPLEIDQEI